MPPYLPSGLYGPHKHINVVYYGLHGSAVECKSNKMSAQNVHQTGHRYILM